MLPRRQERGRRLLRRSHGQLPSHAEEGDGANTRGRAVSGCGREEGAAAGLAAVLGRQRC